jgi:uncharacterized membrane protein YfcA
MGYGTILTPLLMLIFGFEVLQIVPAVLLAELVTGLLAAFLHHKRGNVNFKPRITEQLNSVGYIEGLRKNLPLHLKIAILLSSCSLAGTVAAVFTAVNIPPFWLKMYIGVLVLSMGVVMLICMNKTFRFSWLKMILLGMVASFNKGISGGGYGPVVTGGQVLSGVESKSAVGITSLTEGITCFTGFLLYLAANSDKLDLRLAPWLCLGSVASVPLAAVTVSRLNERKLKKMIATVTISLGTFTIVKTLM